MCHFQNYFYKNFFNWKKKLKTLKCFSIQNSLFVSLREIEAASKAHLVEYIKVNAYLYQETVFTDGSNCFHVNLFST